MAIRFKETEANVFDNLNYHEDLDAEMIALVDNGAPQPAESTSFRAASKNISATFSPRLNGSSSIS